MFVLPVPPGISQLLLTMAAAASATTLPATMKAVLADPAEGGVARVKIEERPVPVPGTGEVLLRVVATGTNRAEIMQAA